MPGTRAVARTMLVAVGVLSGVIATVYVLYRVREVVAVVAVAAFVAVALAPAVAWVERRGPPRAVAILVCYLTGLAGLFGLGLLLAPPLVDGVEQFVRDVPGYVEEIRDSEQLRAYDERYGLTAKISEQADRAPRLLDDAAGELEVVTVGIFQRVFELIIVGVVAFFLLLDGPRWAQFFFNRMAPERRRRAQRVVAESQRAVGGYVAATFAIAALYGIVTFVLMKALGLPFAVPLSVFMALCAVVPLVGSVIGAVPVALVAILHSLPALIVFVVAFALFDQVQSRGLGPYIYKRTMRLHPLLAIVAVLVGASLLGILGALVAIPVAATIQIAVKDVWVARQGTAADPGTGGEAAVGSAA